ncbi:ABC transporter substrate-binding protein [Zhenhengia yiwuensis]|uniref:ABC transporter substrate-binding protein n=1 Tax=Zhenhengia yiwuensis TaxID=2763666 RepID=UPI002A7517B2|nr:ABC transporter substrate-binding protein [Zhenhengia yiwuensis]MDY3367282.1 ABC transporter substrate-binding protein [Zhenhengia yiwuensis]
MKKFAKKFLVLSVVSGLAASTLVGCSQDKPQTDNGTSQAAGEKESSGDTQKESKYKTVVVASLEMNGVFSPFFATTAPDNDIVSMVHGALIKTDRNAQPEADLADYKIEQVEAEDGSVSETIYTFTLKDGVTFSDGTPVTADDIIFSYKVLADPAYDGPSTFSTLPVVGMEEYNKGDATEISGIEKVDDKTVKITLKGIDPSAIWKLGNIEVAPKLYYGVDDAGKEYVKGDMSVPKSRNAAPMGAGAYKFGSFENNVVTLNANENYYGGAPATPTIKYQVTAESNKLEGLKLEEFDISDPSSSPDMVADVEAAGFEYELIDNLGYGYIGINAERIPDKNVRKGLMHLMNRRPAIETYYGDLATVIERPMSTVSWAYPQDATEYYGFDPAKALEYFKAAGYEQVEKNGKVSLEKDGVQLRVEVGIPGGGTMDHPTAPVLTQMKTEMEKMGAVLEIADTDGTVFFDRLNTSDWDMWVAAWGATVDPDMYQVYHSTGPSNHYKIKNDELDKLIVDARQTNDIEVRKDYYSKALDIIMDEAVEMPVYQRKNMYVFNQEIVDMESLPENMTPYYTYFAEVETFRLK